MDPFGRSGNKKRGEKLEELIPVYSWRPFRLFVWWYFQSLPNGMILGVPNVFSEKSHKYMDDDKKFMVLIGVVRCKNLPWFGF